MANAAVFAGLVALAGVLLSLSVFLNSVFTGEDVDAEARTGVAANSASLAAMSMSLNAQFNAHANDLLRLESRAELLEKGLSEAQAEIDRLGRELEAHNSFPRPSD